MVRRIYVDGVFDLFHAGHVRTLKRIKNLDGVQNHVVVGILSDSGAEAYKRRPIFSLEERKEILQSLRMVDQVVAPCPIAIEMDFIRKHNIDLVVHSFRDDKDASKQSPFFSIVRKAGIFREIPYSSTASTTDVLKKIKNSNV